MHDESLFLFSSGVTIILGCFAQTKKHLLATEIIKYLGNLFQKRLNSFPGISQTHAVYKKFQEKHMQIISQKKQRPEIVRVRTRFVCFSFVFAGTFGYLASSPLWLEVNELIWALNGLKKGFEVQLPLSPFLSLSCLHDSNKSGIFYQYSYKFDINIFECLFEKLFNYTDNLYFFKE